MVFAEYLAHALNSSIFDDEKMASSQGKFSNGTANGEDPMKFILVTGGVISGVGKGIISSSLGVLLKNNGYRVSAIKIDPYLNIDAGTFSPYEHGEVYVLDDGGEVDLDLGNYERFLNLKLTSENNITTGKIFSKVTERERRGDYMGKTVQMIPHVTDAIAEWIERVARIPVDGSSKRPHVCIIELGGTIGDIEGMIYLSAFERFQRPAYRERFMNVHVSLVLHPQATGEPKTKPMQNSVRKLRESGIVPDLLICRSTVPPNEHLRQKIADFGMVHLEQVVGVHDVSNIYKVPLLLHEQGVLDAIRCRLRLPPIGSDVLRNLKFNMIHWSKLSDLVDSFTENITIAIVGKYVRIEDAYASVKKALSHAAIHSKRKLIIKFLDSSLLEPHNEIANEKGYIETWEALKSCDGIVVPGGFDKRGVEGKILCCQYARVNKIPFLGICLGMQCAAIEYARNVLGIEGASSTEFEKNLSERQQIIIDMPEHDIQRNGLGGTMRLGKRSTAFLTENSKLRKLYNQEVVDERHRHRYEVNPNIVPELSRQGLLFVGMGVDEMNTCFIQNRRTESSAALMKMAEQHDDDLLHKIETLCLREGGDGITRPAVRMEIIEMTNHPYFVGAQYHPEYISTPLDPSKPFLGLLLAASGQLEGYISGDKAPTPMRTLHEETSPELARLGLI